MASTGAPAPTPGANGVLPAPAVILQKNATTSASRSQPNNAPKPKLKFVIRRLPPGITKTEVLAALGETWKPGAGRLSWANFRKGKISTDLAKPSKPARLYLHLSDATHVKPLLEHFRQVSWVDARKTHQDSVLIGPPILEHALYPGLPQGRRPRTDNKQGQIDQDPEWQDFLMSLTNPVNKPSASESGEQVAQKEARITTTPLIEHLREKKAAKEKSSSKANTKHARGESKEEKSAGSDTKNVGRAGKEPVTSPEKLKKPARKEAVRVTGKDNAKPPANQPSASTSTKENLPPVAPAERKRERGSAATAKAMLQRDLGVGPSKPRRGAKRDVATDALMKSSEAQDGTATASQETPAKAPSSDKTEVTDGARGPKRDRFSRSERRAQKAPEANEPMPDVTQNKVPTAPTILRKPPMTMQQRPVNSTPKVPTGPAASRSVPPTNVDAAPSAPPAVSPSARSGFLKHANASQGITEPLIEAALSVFGAVEKVEIDKRKGFAYVEFVEPEGLQKAVAASPIKVAQGAVQVLERKDRAPRPVRGPPIIPGAPMAPSAPRGAMRGGFGPRGRGGRGGIMSGRGGRGGHVPSVDSSSQSAAPAAATTTPAVAAEAAAPPPPAAPAADVAT